MKNNKTSKHLVHKSLQIGSAGACLLFAILANNAKAQNAYFDVNGTTSGYGTVAGGSYSWDGANWGTSGGTGATTSWTAGTFARFLGGGSYTVTANADESTAGMFLDITGTTMTLAAAGTGDIRVSTAVQGFLTDGSTSVLSITAPIVGTGGVENENGGSLNLYGNNSYSGGTVFGTSGGLNVNNNNSFGTGGITWGVAQQVLADPLAASPLSFGTGNTMTTRAASQLIVVTPAAAPMTFNGAWSLASGTSTVTMNANSTMNIAGNISGAGGNLDKTGVGTLILSGGANTYNGVTTAGAGTLQLGAPNATASSSSLVLGGGTLNAGGFNQANTGTLGMTASGTLAFGATANTALSFANSSALAWSGTLNLSDWQGNSVADGGTSTDTLEIGTTGSGLTSAQLADIEFGGDPSTKGLAVLDSAGFVEEVPEPPAALLGVIGGLSMMWRARRRSA